MNSNIFSPSVFDDINLYLLKIGRCKAVNPFQFIAVVT